MTRNPYSPVCEERGATRVCSDSETTFAVVFREQGEEILAEVHDESLGGLGLLFSAPLVYGVGQEVTIVFSSSIFTATIMHIEQRTDGMYLVGFRCEPLGAACGASQTDCRSLSTASNPADLV